MLLESVVVGFVGSLLGLIAGVGVSAALKGFLGALGVEFPSTSLQLLPRTIVLTDRARHVRHRPFGDPAGAAHGRVSPLAAMRESAVENVGSSRKRILAGADRRRDRRLSASSPRSPAPASSCSDLGVLLVWTAVLILGPVLRSSPPR